MPHVLVGLMNPFVLLLLATHLLLNSPNPVLGADTHSGCYRPTTVEISPRACHSQNTTKKCKVPIVVSVDHKPGMSLCFQGVDAMYEVHPVNATSLAKPIAEDRKCRPLKPLKSVTSTNDPCFDGLSTSARDAANASGVKQQGTYTMCSTTATTEIQICATGAALGVEQHCKSGLHTWVSSCTPSAQCPGGVEVASYYCPQTTIYTVHVLNYTAFKYTLEMKETQFTNTTLGVVSSLLPTTASGDQPTLYTGWTYIANNAGSKPFIRRLPVQPGDCTDYCAIESGDNGDNMFNTKQKCYTPSTDLCASTRELTWQEFNTSWDDDRVALPNPTEEGTIHEDGSYTTHKIATSFTYKANIDMNTARADPKVTATCEPNKTAPALDAGIQKRTYPELDLMYVRRVCDQVVLSLYDCVLRYSHHDGSSMYWTVENTGNESECKIHVIDDTTVYNFNFSVEPQAMRPHDSISTDTTKKLPAWVIPMIVSTGVASTLIICIVVILCLRARSRRAKESLRQREAMPNPLHAYISDDVEMTVYASSRTAQHDNGPTGGNHLLLPANITARDPQTQTEFLDDEIHGCEAMNLPPRPVTPCTTEVLMEPIAEELMVIVMEYQEPEPEAPEIIVHENEPFYASVPIMEAQQLPTASSIPQPHQHLSRDAGRALQTDFGPRMYPLSLASPFSFHTDQHSITTDQQSSLSDQQVFLTDQQAISAEQQTISADQHSFHTDQQAILIEQQRVQTRPMVETSFNPELTVCPVRQRFNDEDHDSADVTHTQRELPYDEIHGSEAMHLPPRPVTPRTPAMHVDPSQEELMDEEEHNEPEPEPEPPVMDIMVTHHNEEEPLHAVVPVMEAQPQQPPAAAVLQRVSRRPDPLAHLSREQRRELLYLQTDFGPRVRPSPEISPRHSPRTARFRRRVNRWRYRGAAGGRAETIVEEPHTTESPPAVSVASNEADEQSVLTEEQSMATDQQSTHTEQQAALPVVRPAYQGELPEDSMETMYPSSRWFTEPEIGDELLPPAPTDPPVRPAWLLREHVSAFLYLVVHIAFEIHSESEKDGVLREMKNNWSQLDTIVLGRIPGAVPLVPMTEDRRESVIPAEWEAELVRATVQSADFCMHHEQREESNEAAINVSVHEGTQRVLQYINIYGGRLVPCLLFIKRNTEGE